MGKYIVYQGHAELFRWRKVDESGATLYNEDGSACQSELLSTREAAINAVKAIEPNAEIEVRPTIEEVAAEEEVVNG